MDEAEMEFDMMVIEYGRKHGKDALANKLAINLLALAQTMNSKTTTVEFEDGSKVTIEAVL